MTHENREEKMHIHVFNNEVLRDSVRVYSDQRRPIPFESLAAFHSAPGRNEGVYRTELGRSLSKEEVG